MNNQEAQKKRREPLFHIVNNDSIPLPKALAIRGIAILVALIIVGIMSVILIRENPFEIYKALFTGAFIDIWTFAQNVALLLMFGIAVVPAFKMKFINMGANGQVLVGCLAAVACMKFIPQSYPEISNWLLLIIMVAASIIAATVWSVIPAVFKAFFNTNETLFTLMMNYIALALVDYFVFNWDKRGSGNIGIVNLLSRMGWFPDVAENKYLLTVIVALAVTVLMFVYMKFTKHGFEVSLVGESVNTAKYVGINVKKVIIRTLAMGGIVCGIIGALYAGSISHTVNTAVGGIGFTAVLVAWLAAFNPLIMIAASFFVIFINAGAENVSVVFQLNSNDYANIVVGIIFFCIIGCEFFIRYKIMFNKNRNKKEVAAE